MKGQETKGTMGIHSLNTNTSGSCELTVLISHQAVFETLNVIYDVDFEFKKEHLGEGNSMDTRILECKV